MAKKKMSKMVVEKNYKRKGVPRFPTDSFSFETNKTLLQHQVMTFSTKVAKKLGHTEGTLSLTLVWGRSRRTVRFVRDKHLGRGWRSQKKDFKEFAALVGFKKHQGYSVFQVLGLGDPAFELEKIWEFCPNGGTVTLLEGYGGSDDLDLGGQGSSVAAAGPVKKIKWRRSIFAKKTTRGAAELVKKEQSFGGDAEAGSSRKRPMEYVGKNSEDKKVGDANVGGEKKKRRKKLKMIRQFTSPNAPPGYEGLVKNEPVWE